MVVVTGDADLNSADQLRESLDGAMPEGGGPIVDLTGATLLDSRTIGVLASANERLGEERLRIVCGDPNVLRLFATIGLEHEFAFFASRDEAFAA